MWNNFFCYIFYLIQALQQNQGTCIIHAGYDYLHYSFYVCILVAELEAIKAKKFSNLGHLEVCLCSIHVVEYVV